MKRFRFLLLAMVFCAAVAPRSEAATISLFMNGAFVDTGTEGANLQATLVGCRPPAAPGTPGLRTGR